MSPEKRKNPNARTQFPDRATENPKEKPSFPLRLPDELRTLATAAAKENGRSLNAEIVERIRASFQASAPAKPCDGLLALLHDYTQPEIGATSTHMAITARWTVVFDIKEAQRLTVGGVKGSGIPGFTEADANHVFLAVRPIDAKAYMSKDRAASLLDRIKKAVRRRPA